MFRVENLKSFAQSFYQNPPGLPASSPRASRSVFVLLCWSFGSLDPFLERKPRKFLCPSMLFSMRPNRINRMRQPLSCRSRVRFSKQSDQPCRNLGHLYFWLIRSFTDPAYTCSIFVVRFLVDCLLSQSCSLCL